MVGYYRQWSKVNRLPEKIVKLADSIQFKNFDDQIKLLDKLIASDKETIILGDFNFDAKCLYKTEYQKTSAEKRYNQIYKTIKNELFSKNFTQLIKENTRENKIMDQIYVNTPTKIKHSSSSLEYTSDHALIKVIRSMKINQIEEKYIKVRNMKNVDFHVLQYNIIQRQEYDNILKSDSSNFTAENLIKIITEEYDKVAPVKKVKIQNKEKDYISDDTKKIINEKNEIYKAYHFTKCNENKLKLKNIKNLVKSKIKSDTNLGKSKEYQKCNNVNKMWKITKNQIWGRDCDFPEKILSENILTEGSKNVSEVMNWYYKNKAENLIRNAPINHDEALKHYKQKIKKPKNKLSINQIKMYDLKKMFNEVKKSFSTGIYNISMKMIDNVKEALFPSIL